MAIGLLWALQRNLADQFSKQDPRLDEFVIKSYILMAAHILLCLSDAGIIWLHWFAHATFQKLSNLLIFLLDLLPGDTLPARSAEKSEETGDAPTQCGAWLEC